MKKSDRFQQLHAMVNEPGISGFIALLNDCLDEWKNELVDAKTETVIELQGAIKRVRGIIADIKRDPIKKEFKDGSYTGE